MTSVNQSRIVEAIQEFFWYKCQGKQNYSQSISEDNSIYFTSVVDSIDGFDPIVGFVNDITISYTLEVKGKHEVNITSIPFNPEDKFIKGLAWYVDGLMDCDYYSSIEYSILVKEFCDILSQYSSINQESEFGYEDYPLDNYEAIMAIVALPDPIEAEEYLALVQNPLAGLTEEKSWYGRPDPKRFAKVKRRTKYLRNARQLKNMVLSFEPNFIEIDDCAY
jgi:hypothetical protein